MEEAVARRPYRSPNWKVLGRPKHPTQLAREAWETAARDWDRFVEEKQDYQRWELHGRALVRAIGPVSGLRVLDLGCGQGWLTRQLARKGARVTGVDWSPTQIENAREYERKRPRGADYVCADTAAIGQHWPSATFDRVVSCMAFMDMPRVDRTLRAAARLLRPDGRLVFSVTHPMNSAPRARWLRETVGRHGPWLVDAYFDEGPHEVRWRLGHTGHTMKVPQWHRTFETWTRFLLSAGFAVYRMWEPRPSRRQAHSRSGFEGVRRIPYYLIVDARPVPRTRSGPSPRPRTGRA